MKNKDHGWTMIVVLVFGVFTPLACGTNDQTNGKNDNQSRPNDTEMGDTEEDSASILDTGNTEDNTEISESDDTVPYYHLRIELSSASNWAKLPLDPNLVLKIGEPQIKGEGDRIRARFDLMEINGPVGKVTITADYAVETAAIENGLEHLFGPLGKGSNGEVTVRVYGVDNQQNATQLGSVTAGDRVQEATVEFDWEKVRGVETKMAETVAVPRMAWAVYYPWYRDRNPFEQGTLKELTEDRAGLAERVATYWSERRDPKVYQSGTRKYSLLDQPIGPEDVGMFSYDPVAACLQVDQAREAGIDGFLAEYQGEADFTHGATGLVLDCAEQSSGFHLGMLVSPQGALADVDQNKDRAVELLFQWVKDYVENYGDRSAVMKVEGRPLAITYSTGLLEPYHWEQLRQKLRNAGAEVFLVADNASSNDFDEYIPCFDGADGVSMNAETGAWLGRQLRYNGIFTDERPKLWMRDVRPGYDDTHLFHRSETRFVDREGGDFFHRQFDEAEAHDPQWLRITTWNEYYENTYIEPSQVHGTKYLDIAKERIEQWKSNNRRSAQTTD